MNDGANDTNDDGNGDGDDDYDKLDEEIDKSDHQNQSFASNFHPSRMRLRLIEQMQQMRRYNQSKRRLTDIPAWPVRLIHPSQRGTFIKKLLDTSDQTSTSKSSSSSSTSFPKKPKAILDDDDDHDHGNGYIGKSNNQIGDLGLGYVMRLGRRVSSSVRFSGGSVSANEIGRDISDSKATGVVASVSWSGSREKPWISDILDKKYEDLIPWIRNSKMSPNEPIVTLIPIVPEPDDDLHNHEDDNEDDGKTDVDCKANVPINVKFSNNTEKFLAETKTDPTTFVHITYPIHIAVHNHNQGLFKFLLSHNQSLDLNVVSGKWGWTPLHRSCYWGWSDFVRELVRAGANPNITDVLGRTPAQLTKFDSCLEWLP